MSLDTSFFGSLKVASVEWSLSRATTQTRLRGGVVIPSQIGASLWQGRVTLSPAYHRDLAEVEALLARLTAPGRFVLAYDPRYNGPRSDPGGVTLGNATPAIHTLNSDNARMRVEGLPPGYVLSPGDYIGWTYGSNPIRYALHRLDGPPVTASGAGLSPLFSVTPHIRPGAGIGTAVVLVRPPIKALINDASYGAGAPLITQGGTFGIMQTLR